MPEEFGKLTPDDVMRTADEFSEALRTVWSIEPQTESLRRSYGNDPQSQPPELVAASEQLRCARGAVQEKGRILYHVASQWDADAKLLMSLAVGLQATSLTKNLYTTLEVIVKSIKTLAFQRRENPLPPADMSNATAPATPTLQDRVRECEMALGRYAALRPELFRQLLLVPKGWKVQYKRDPAKGDPSLPVKITYHTPMVNEIGGQPFTGIATIASPETYADFHDFAVLDPDGNGTKPDTETATVEMRLAFLLSQLLDVMRALAGGLPFIEREAKTLGLQTDTTVLSRLAIHLPVFPYWPTLKGMTQADWDKIVADEKPLLDDARLTLRRLALEDYTSANPATAPAPMPTHNADFTMVNWFGEEYTFALGVQSSALKALWEEWEKTGLGLHQDTIRNSIDAERDSFRMDTAFRKHPAFGTMIKKIGDGKYKLAPWPGGTTPAPSQKKKSAVITSGARQKRV